jgi:tRNA(Phe) wybutosine-synthesizing methylase Tyw3
MEILKVFRKEKSLKELEENFEVQLPDKEVLDIINDIADLQEAILLLNLA